MAARFENRNHSRSAPVWAGKYRTLHNLPHWHLEHELIACRGGQAQLTLEGHPYVLTDGSAAFCPSGSVHNLRSDSGATLVIAQTDAELTRFLGEGFRLKQCVFPDRYGIFDRLDRIVQEQHQELPFHDRRSGAVMTALLIDISRGEEFTTGTPVLQGSIAQYRDLLRALEEESEFLTFPEAAQRMHMSQAYFSRYFHQVTGMPFTDYLNLLKVDRAVEILSAEPGISTVDLALRCGFNTLRSFNRVFRQITGYSPKTLPRDFTLQLRRYADGQEAFDPTLEGSVML